MRALDSIINSYLFVAYGLALVMLEWLHNRGLTTDIYRMFCDIYFWPIVWMIDNDCCPYWLAELLKLAVNHT